MAVLTLASSENYILLPGGILDISSGCLITDKAVVIKEGRINELVEKSEIGELTRRGKFKIIDLQGLVLLPGLVDCHVHLAIDGTGFQKAMCRWENDEAMAENISQSIRAYLQHGIVAVRDGGDKECIGLKARDQFPNEPSPIVRASGFAIRKEGYYGSFLGEGIKEIAEVKTRIKKLIQLGVNQIKVLVSGIVSFKEYAKVGAIQFTLQELKTIVEISHNYGLKVMAHASSDHAVRTAIEAGVDSIEHGYFSSEASLELMAERGIPWVPTVVPVYMQTLEPWKHAFSSEQFNIIERTYKLQLERIAKAASLGVMLGIGTDAGAAGVMHGESYFQELKLFKAAGLPNLAILQAAILNGAKIIGLENELGAIRPGKKPLLIAVSENPLKSPQALQHVELMICLH